MKKVIKSRLYDTSTAKLIAYWDDDKGSIEALYRKRTGEYFVCLTNQLHHPEIVPVDYATAANWADQHLTPELYNAIFGPVPLADEHKRLTLNLRADVIEELKRRAAKEGKSISQLMQELIDKASQA